LILKFVFEKFSEIEYNLVVIENIQNTYLLISNHVFFLKFTFAESTGFAGATMHSLLCRRQQSAESTNKMTLVVNSRRRQLLDGGAPTVL
jgi:hypothetical protein